EAVTPPKPWTSDRTLQGSQLLAKRDVFEDHFVLPATGQCQSSRHQDDGLQHAVMVAWVRRRNQRRQGGTAFWRTTRGPDFAEPLRQDGERAGGDTTLVTYAILQGFGEVTGAPPKAPAKSSGGASDQDANLQRENRIAQKAFDKFCPRCDSLRALKIIVVPEL